MPLLLLLAFIAVPIVEIAVILRVGDAIGTWPTVALIVLTAAVGALLVRAQGFAVLRRIQDDLALGIFPAGALFEGAALLVAGVLLLTPGFVTDALGLALLVPPLRRALGRILARRAVAVRGGAQTDDGVIEGEYREIPPERIGRDRHREADENGGDERRR